MSYQFYHLQQRRKFEDHTAGNIKEMENCHDPRLWSNNAYIRHQATMDDVMGLSCNGDGLPKLSHVEVPREPQRKSQSEVSSLKEQISKLKSQLAEYQERHNLFRRMSLEMNKDVLDAQKNKENLEKALELVRQDLERVKKKGNESLKRLTDDHAKKLRDYEALCKRLTTNKNAATELMKNYQKQESVFPTLENEIKALKQKLADEVRDRKRSEEFEKAFKETELKIRSEYEERLKMSNEVNEENKIIQNELDKLVKESDQKIEELLKQVASYKIENDRMPQLKEELDKLKNQVKTYEEKLAVLSEVEEKLDNVAKKETRSSEKMKRQMDMRLSEIEDLKDETIRELEKEREQVRKKSEGEAKRLEKERASFSGQLLKKDEEVGELMRRVSALREKINEEKKAAKEKLLESQEQFGKEIEELQKQLDNVGEEAKKEKLKHASEENALKRQLKELKLETEEYQRRIEKAEEETIPQLQQQIQEWKEKHAYEVEKLRKENDSQFIALEKKLVNGKVNELLEQIENLKGEKNKEVELLQNQLKDERANQRALEGKLTELTMELGKQKISKDAENQAAEVSQALEEKEQELKMLRDELNGKERELQDARQELAEIEKERFQLVQQLNEERQPTESLLQSSDPSSSINEELQGEKLINLSLKVKQLEKELAGYKESHNAKTPKKLRSAFVNLDAVSDDTDENEEEISNLRVELERKDQQLEELRLKIEENAGSEGKEPLNKAVERLKSAMQKQQVLLKFEQDKCDRLTQELKEIKKKSARASTDRSTGKGDTGSNAGFNPQVAKNNMQGLSFNQLSQLHEMTRAAMKAKFEAGKVEYYTAPAISLAGANPIELEDKKILLTRIDEDEKRIQKEIEKIKRNEKVLEKTVKRAEILKTAIRENPPLTSQRNSQKGVEKALVRAEMLKRAIREDPPLSGRRTVPKPR